MCGSLQGNECLEVSTECVDVYKALSAECLEVSTECVDLYKALSA